MSDTFETWFQRVSGFPPHPWQSALASDPEVFTRLVRVPTGMGKTLGVVGAWAYHRLYRRDLAWPARLVIALPMRVLVEQTEKVVRDFLASAQLFASDIHIDAPDPHLAAVHTLMGGVSAEPWHLCPEQPAVLLGTQDMLLSRALNRGYASPRPRWPMEYALLNRDCLWVLDEIQLMGVGLSTSAQLQAFRESDYPVGSVATWWMSATLQSSWFERGEHASQVGALEGACLRIPANQRSGGSFAGRKTCEVVSIPRSSDKNAASWAAAVLSAHRESTPGPTGRITLAVCNTVDDALSVHTQLAKQLKKDKSNVELHLVHSRFRPMEREAWVGSFLSREACTSDADRIVVATQVVEAGVDISATALVTQLAPWASLVQRFGRCARYGGEGHVIVVDRSLDAKTALPYDAAELDAALAAVSSLPKVDCAALEAFEDGLREDQPERLQALYPYDPAHLLTRREFDELFDTESDLTGHDLDVSRFIRDNEDTDVSVFWRVLGRDGRSVLVPDASVQADRRELCSVPVTRAQAWLLPSGGEAQRPIAFVWDYVDGTWTRLRRGHVFPGQVIVVDAASGGYDVEVGFTASAGGQVATLQEPAGLGAEARAELASDRDDVSAYPYKTIATHGQEAAAAARALAAALRLSGSVQQALVAAAALHDIGKCHPAFQYGCAEDKRDESVRARLDLAKAPASVWRQGANRYSPPDGPRRRGFRHELVSVLMLFEWLRRTDPMHAALLGPHEPLINAGLLAPLALASDERAHFPLAEAFDAASFDLVAYLICAHHGKVRGVWSSTPQDQDEVIRSPQHALLRGVCAGDQLPSVLVGVSHERSETVPALELHLDPASMGLSERYGRSWVDRVTDLRRAWGPTALAYLETLVRVADVRASRLSTDDARLAQGGIR